MTKMRSGWWVGCLLLGLGACGSDDGSGDTEREQSEAMQGGEESPTNRDGGATQGTDMRADGAAEPGASDRGDGDVREQMRDATAAEPPMTTADGGAQQPVGGDAFATCVAELKPVCSYDDHSTACASLTTPTVPLTSGEQWGGTELRSGPYGAFVEWNAGRDFENPINFLESTCDVLAGSFGEPAETTREVLDLRGSELSLYTVFRPACMKEGEKYPVITWGNGTCGQSGGYASLLASVASHGFVIFASNSRFTDAGNDEMLKALDFAKAANEDPESVFYQKLNLDKVGAMGHSQGASATANAAGDPRIKALILWNGAFRGQPAKPFLAVAGDRDTGSPTPASLATFVNDATQPGAWLFYHKILETGGNVTGHLMLMMQPERVVDVTVAWWKYMLLGDEEAKKFFVGDACGVCNMPEDFEYGLRGLM